MAGRVMVLAEMPDGTLRIIEGRAEIEITTENVYRSYMAFREVIVGIRFNGQCTITEDYRPFPDEIDIGTV